MEAVGIERSTWIDAPRPRVWQALTDPSQFAQWFLPAMPGTVMTRDDNGTISMQLGPMSVAFATLEMVEAPHRATSQGLPDKLFTTTYTLDEENGGTRITVAISGFETLPEIAQQERLEVTGKAWEATLENLKAFIGENELPHPQAAVAPLFGYLREGKKIIAVERSIWIKATPERVWQAITDPEQIALWFSPGSTFKLTSAEVGARLYVENPENGEEMYVQIVDEFDPPYRFTTRTAPDPAETPHLTHYVLQEENGGTRLTLTYTGYELEPVESRYLNLEQNAFGFGMMLENLRASIDHTTLPFPQGF